MNKPIQKFHKYDHVQIANKLGIDMSHFTSGVDAIVMYSYADEYGDDDTKSYGLYIQGKGTCAWYEEDQLTLIEGNNKALLDQWQETKAIKDAQASDLDYIFAQDEAPTSGVSLQTLANCFGLDSLWGDSGKGFEYASNARIIQAIVTPFVIKHDKQGFLDTCAKYKLTI